MTVPRSSVRRVRASAILLGAALVGTATITAGCVTETVMDEPGIPIVAGPAPEVAATAAPTAPPVGAPAAAPKAPGATDAAAQREFEFGRTLQSLDKRVDTWVFLGSEAGDDARGRRAVEESAIEAVVAQHLARLLELAADVGDTTRRKIAVKSLAFTRSADAKHPLAADATGVLVAALHTNDPQLQTNAAFALARRKDPSTPVQALLDAARSGDADVRVNSLLALWHVLDVRGEKGMALDAPTREAALPIIETSLFDPDDPMARGYAAAAMGALGDPRGVDSLLNLLRDTNPVVRTHTALALGKLGDRRAVEPLVDLIDETPRGPKGAVILGISLLLEHEGIAVPPDMPEYERNWSEFVQRVLPAKR
ncbi:MAG: HEAT repeat domain-containing protein [Planctomycetes bacterium]|nr:HEAT repeat domain-containing protein [Planctomycetota bacterium]